jgi:hypothetical protein
MSTEPKTEASEIEDPRRKELMNKEGRRIKRQMEKEKASMGKGVKVTIGRATSFVLGSGAQARQNNIMEIRRLLAKGITEEQILDSELELIFKAATIREYIRLAAKHPIKKAEGGTTG